MGCSHGLLNHPRGKEAARNWTAGNPALARDSRRKLKIRYVTKSGPMVIIPARILRCRLRSRVADGSFHVRHPFTIIATSIPRPGRSVECSGKHKNCFQSEQNQLYMGIAVSRNGRKNSMNESERFDLSDQDQGRTASACAAPARRGIAFIHGRQPACAVSVCREWRQAAHAASAGARTGRRT